MKTLSENVYVPSPGDDRVSSLPFSSQQNPDLGGWEGGPVLSASLRAEHGHETESWPPKGTCWSPGFLGELWKLTHSSCLLGCPFCFPERQVWPCRWATPLASTGQLEPENTDKAERQRSGDTSPGPLGEKTHTQFSEATVYSSFSLGTVEKKNLNR